MAIKLNKPDPMSSLTNLIEMFSNINQKYKIKEDREIANYTNTINTLNDSIDEVQTGNSISNLMSVINSSNVKFSKYGQTAIASSVIQNKISDKKQMYDDYKYQMDEAQKMYLGETTPIPGIPGEYKTVKGIQNLTDDDVNNWTMEKIASELNRVDDFNSALYEDFENKTPVKFRYNPGGVTDRQLIDRMNDYRGQLQAGLEAMQGDGDITDEEVFFILSNNKQGLINARKLNVDAATKQIRSITTAQGVIKKNIAALQAYQAKEDIRENRISNVRGANLMADVLNSGVDMDGQYEAEYDAKDEDFKAGTTLDQFIAGKAEEMGTIGPAELLEQWAAELGLLETTRKNQIRMYKKWSGYNYSAGNVNMGDANLDEFDAEFGQDECESLNLPGVPSK